MFLIKNLRKHLFLFSCLLIFGALFFGANSAYSEDFTSNSYKMPDPVIGVGGYGSSTSFRMFGVISDINTGTSTSLSFGNNFGFLYYPFVSTPIVSATGGNGQVSLSWTASEGFLGWNVSG